MSMVRPDSASARPSATDSRNRSRSVRRSYSAGETRTPAGLPFRVMTTGGPVSAACRSQRAACPLNSPTGTMSSATLMARMLKIVGGQGP